ncbi:MAG: ABC transporter permease [Micromonosporaceae bacterium]|nr:ABC transporter permease [Micromonosporaceae bacterium]
MGRLASTPAGRIWAVCLRDVTAAHSVGYTFLLVVGFLEPVLYLLSMGFGVGGMVGEVVLADGARVSYASFVAPAMLAASAMNGPFFEGSIGFFSKMRYRKLFDATISTPVTPFEVAAGELLWSLGQGAMYSLAFCTVMVALGLATLGQVLAVLPAALLIGFAFGGLGLLLATFINSWKDFDYLGAIIFSMFLFSGTFTPVEAYPGPAQIIVWLTPLYHGIELTRGLILDALSLSMLADAAYLVVVGLLGLWLASRRIARTLCR